MNGLPASVNGSDLAISPEFNFCETSHPEVSQNEIWIYSIHITPPWVKVQNFYELL